MSIRAVLPRSNRCADDILSLWPPTVQTDSSPDSATLPDFKYGEPLDLWLRQLPAKLDHELISVWFRDHNEDRIFDKGLPLGGLLSTLAHLPNLRYLEFSLHQDVDPLPLGFSPRTVALNHLCELVFVCWDDRGTAGIDSIFHSLRIPPTARVTVEMESEPEVSDESVIDVDDTVTVETDSEISDESEIDDDDIVTTLTDFAATVTKRYSSTPSCSVLLSEMTGLFTVHGPSLGDEPLLSIALNGAFRSISIQTLKALPKFCISCPSLRVLDLPEDFDLVSPLDVLLNVVANMPQLRALDFASLSSANLPIQQPRNHSSRAHLMHLLDFKVAVKAKCDFPVVDCLLSSINISARTKLDLCVEYPENYRSGFGLLDIPFLNDAQQQVSWCHLELSDYYCVLKGITEGPASNHDGSESRIPFFEVWTEDPASRYCVDTTQCLHTFLSRQPITRLWIDVEKLTRGEMPKVEPASWDDLLSSVPFLEELGLRVDIWECTRAGASCALVESARALFDVLQRQHPKVICSELKRLWFIARTTDSLASCVRYIRDLVRVRDSMAVPIREVRLAVDRDRWEWEATRDGDINRLRSEIEVEYGVEFVVEFDMQVISFPKPSIEE